MLKVQFTGIAILVLLTLTVCHSWHSNSAGVMQASCSAQITPYRSGSNVWQQHDPEMIWQTLQNKSRIFLVRAMAQHSNDPIYRGWLKLAILNHEYNKSYAKLIVALQQWQAEYLIHPAQQLIP